MTLLMQDKPEKQTNIPPVRWERVRCNLCGQDRTRLYHQERLDFFDSELDFEIVRCCHCGLVYTNPRLDAHNANYLFSDETCAQIEAHARAKKPVFESALKQIHLCQRRIKGSSGGKLLDVGCGSGHFMLAASQNGYEVHGIEPAPVSARYAQDQLSLPVIQKNILEVDFPPQSFDIITAWDVIEHVSDPRAVLTRCSHWLRPGGILAVRFPSARWQKFKGILFHKLCQSNRPAFGATMHLYFFSEITFTKICRDIGLKVYKTQTTPLEANTGRCLIDKIKLVGNIVMKSVENISGLHPGNLEIYCYKPN